VTKQSIVILHGWGSNPERWIAVHDQLTLLSKELGSELHIPLMPGFDGEIPRKAMNIDDYVVWLNDYIEAHKLQNVVLVGHSNGGRIAIRYVATHKNVEKLILVAAAGLPNSHLSLKKTVFKFVAKIGKVVLQPLNKTSLYKLAEKFLYKMARESDYYKASPIMKDTMINLLSYDATNDVKKITCPSLCVWGKDDTATPLWMGEKIAAAIPRCTIKVVDGGHSIHMTHPKIVAGYIKDFLQ